MKKRRMQMQKKPSQPSPAHIRHRYKKLAAMGIVEQIGMDDDGQPRYALTEFGRQACEKAGIDPGDVDIRATVEAKGEG